MHETVPKYNCLILIRAICQMSSSLRSNPLYGFTQITFFAFCVLYRRTRAPIPYKGVVRAPVCFKVVLLLRVVFMEQRHRVVVSARSERKRKGEG